MCRENLNNSIMGRNVKKGWKTLGEIKELDLLGRRRKEDNARTKVYCNTSCYRFCDNWKGLMDKNKNGKVAIGTVIKPRKMMI